MYCPVLRYKSYTAVCVHVHVHTHISTSSTLLLLFGLTVGSLSAICLSSHALSVGWSSFSVCINTVSQFSQKRESETKRRTVNLNVHPA